VTTPVPGRQHPPGYQLAIDVLSDVAARTGSPAARWAADYLAADPDRHAAALAADLALIPREDTHA
jgi:hypothetical protein